MLRHKKEMKQHRLAEFNKKLEDIERKYAKMIYADRESTKAFVLQRNQEIEKLAKEYGVNWNNREQMGYYWSHVVHKPIGRINPKHDRTRRCHRTSTKNGIKPLKQQFNEEIKEYDPEGDEIYYAYSSGNY